METLKELIRELQAENRALRNIIRNPDDKEELEKLVIALDHPTIR